jgi:ubiquinone/menaquinone biosynthesis C-methylase UbiE
LLQFDLLARTYDRLFKRPVDDPLPGLVDVRPGVSVLDVGGGTGRNARALQDAGAWVVVCDSSLKMLQEAADRDLPVVRGDVAHLPFAAGAFDRVLVVDAFHHFVDPLPAVCQAQAIPELLRILKRAGLLVLEEPDIRKWQTRLIAAAEQVLMMRSSFLPPQALVEGIERKGGLCVKRQEHGFSVELVFHKTGGEP